MKGVTPIGNDGCVFLPSLWGIIHKLNKLWNATDSNMIADNVEELLKTIEISKLLTGGNYHMKRKYAITRTVGNNEIVLKTFDENCKDEALAYGAEIAKSNTEGVISCVFALFNDDDKMNNYDVRVFEVW